MAGAGGWRIHAASLRQPGRGHRLSHRSRHSPRDGRLARLRGPHAVGRRSRDRAATDSGRVPQVRRFPATLASRATIFSPLGRRPRCCPPEDDAQFITWLVNFDFEWRPADWWRVRGEVFRGANLSSYLGGIGQGVCPCRRVSIRGAGGWLELGWDWSPCWRSPCRVRHRRPRTSIVSVGRIQNHSIYTNVLVDLLRN
jgi:hypothetical protein